MTQQPGQGPGQFGPQGPRGPQGLAIPITGKYVDIVAGTDALTSGWTWK
ncbi:MAG: hypothetical protein ACOH16_09500 [Propionibacteriaceae bacterium]